MNEKVEKNTMEESESQKNKYLILGLDEDQFGIEIEYIREIIGIQPISEIPEMPNFIQGIINLRGQIIPTMDLRKRLEKATKEYNDRTCIVIIDILDFSMGLIVDKVLEIADINEEDLVSPPDYGNESQNEYLKWVAVSKDNIKLILNCERLLDEDEIDVMEDL